MSTQPPKAPGAAVRGSFDPWTATEDEAHAAELGVDVSDPVRGPMAQWEAAQQIDRIYRPRIQGDRCATTMIAAIAACARAGLVAPRWLADPFFEASERIALLEVRTIDEAFGRPMKDRQVGKARHKYLHAWRFYDAAVKFLRANPEVIIDKELGHYVADYMKSDLGIDTHGAEVDRMVEYAIKEQGRPRLGTVRRGGPGIRRK